jgi:hypothetical protein
VFFRRLYWVYDRDLKPLTLCIEIVRGILRQLVRRIGIKSAYDLVPLSQRKAKMPFPLIHTIHVYI